MVIAHLHGGSRLGWRVVVRWRAGWMLVARSCGSLVVMVGGDALPIGMGLRFTAAVGVASTAGHHCLVFAFVARGKPLQQRSHVSHGAPSQRLPPGSRTSG